VQKLKDQVLNFAKDLEGQIPLDQIASATKHEFGDKCSESTIANYLANKPEYFSKSKKRIVTKKQSLKSKLIQAIKSLKEDDPILEQLASEVTEPLHLVKNL
jgi:hypothetical protein